MVVAVAGRARTVVRMVVQVVLVRAPQCVLEAVHPPAVINALVAALRVLVGALVAALHAVVDAPGVVARDVVAHVRLVQDRLNLTDRYYY